MPHPEGDPEPRRTRRFRRFMTTAFRPLSVIAPIALVLTTGIIPPATFPEGSTLLVSMIIVGVILLGILVALVRTWDLRWARTGERLFTRREAWTVLLLAFLLAWWCLGMVWITHGDGYGGLAFVNGMFGVLVTVGVLFYWATRPIPERATS
jgi:hypothetical protein